MMKHYYRVTYVAEDGFVNICIVYAASNADAEIFRINYYKNRHPGGLASARQINDTELSEAYRKHMAIWEA